MKIEDLTPLYIVTREEEISQLRKIIEEMPIEISDTSSTRCFREMIFQFDYTGDHDFMIFLDPCEERKMMDDYKEITDSSLLKRIIKPIGKEVKISDDVDSLTIDYSKNGNERSAYVKFWNGTF